MIIKLNTMEQYPALKKITILFIAIIFCNVLYAQTFLEELDVKVSIKHASCHGASDGFVQVEVKNGIPPYIFKWATGETTNILDGLIAGEYTVLITDKFGRSVLKTFIVNEPKELKAKINVANLSSDSQNLHKLDLSVTGGNMPYRYEWISDVPVRGFLKTDEKPNNGSGGIMFDIKGKEDLTINGLEVFLNSGKKQIDIFYKKGTYKGFEEKKSAWKKLDSYSITSDGPTSPRYIPLNKFINIKANEVISLFIASPNHGLKYSNNHKLQRINYQNNNLEIYSGIGRGSSHFESVIFADRKFTGGIYYTVKRSKIKSAVEDLLSSENGNYTVLIKDKNGCLLEERAPINTRTNLHSSFRDKVIQFDTTTQTTKQVETSPFNLSSSPNPSAGSIAVVFDAENSFNIRMEVIDIKGKIWMNELVKLNRGKNVQNYNLTKLPVGVYVLKAAGGGHFQDLRIIIN